MNFACKINKKIILSFIKSKFKRHLYIKSSTKKKHKLLQQRCLSSEELVLSILFACLCY